MWRDIVLLSFTFLSTSALSNTLLELCKTNFLSNECKGASLDCQNIHIVSLEASMMHIHTEIQCLSLGNTHLTNIEEGAFDDSTSLKYLDLHGNMLSHLDPELFVNMKELEYLDLSNNTLSSLIDEKLFMSQNKLKVLDLSSNTISHIDVKVMTTLTSITKLSLSANPFHCDCQVLEIILWCRALGLNTSVECKEPKELEGSTWEVMEDMGGCNENLGLLKTAPEGTHLVPKYMKMSDLESVVATVILISLIVLIMLLICASTSMVFYIRKKRNKVEPQIENSVQYDTGTTNVHIEETMPPIVHQGTPYIVDFKLKRLSIQERSENSDITDVSKENLLDTQVLVRSSEKQKYVENARYSGDYDNVCP